MTDIGLILTVVSITVLACTAVMAGAVFLFWKYVSKKKEEKISEKSSNTLNDLRRRIAVSRLLDNGELDDVIFTVGEVEELVRTETNFFLEQQSRKFFECALNLMAHSYPTLEQAKETAYDMIEVILSADPADEGDSGDQNVTFG